MSQVCGDSATADPNDAGRQISRWEKGVTPPPRSVASKLLDFLESPDLSFEMKGGQSEWAALRHLPWFDAESPHVVTKGAVRADSPLVDLRAVKGRRESLEPLVSGIFDPYESDEVWHRRLARCSAHTSPNPLKKIRVLEMAKGGAFDIYAHRRALEEDIKDHGQAMRFLFSGSSPLFDGVRDELRNSTRAAVQEFAEAFLPGFSVGQMGARDYLSGLSLSELDSFLVGIQAASGCKERGDMETQGDILRRLIRSEMFLQKERQRAEGLETKHFAEKFDRRTAAESRFAKTEATRIIDDHRSFIARSLAPNPHAFEQTGAGFTAFLDSHETEPAAKAFREAYIQTVTPGGGE